MAYQTAESSKVSSEYLDQTELSGKLFRYTTAWQIFGFIRTSWWPVSNVCILDM